MTKMVACEINCKRFVYFLLYMPSDFNNILLCVFNNTEFVLMDVVNN
jgi:hypothetical protein